MGMPGQRRVWSGILPLHLSVGIEPTTGWGSPVSTLARYEVGGVDPMIKAGPGLIDRDYIHLFSLS